MSAKFAFGKTWTGANPTLPPSNRVGVAHLHLWPGTSPRESRVAPLGADADADAPLRNRDRQRPVDQVRLHQPTSSISSFQSLSLFLISFLPRVGVRSRRWQDSGVSKIVW